MDKSIFITVLSNLIIAVLASISYGLSLLLEKILQKKSKKHKKGSAKNVEKESKSIKIYFYRAGFFVFFFLVILFIYNKYFYFSIEKKLETKKTQNIRKVSESYKRTFFKLKGEVDKIRNRVEIIDFTRFETNTLTDAEKEYIKDINILSEDIITTLSDVKDVELSWGYRETKYDFLSYTYAIKAEIVNDTLEKTNFINKSLENADNALSIYYLCEAINKFSYSDSSKYGYNFKRFKKWLLTNENYSRLMFIKSWMYSLRHRIGQLKDGCIIARYFWNKINPNYRNKWPAKKNPSLRFCIKDKK